MNKILFTEADISEIDRLKRNAEDIAYSGFANEAEAQYRMQFHRSFLSCGIIVIFTKDGPHWFPNEQWQYCWHLSISWAEGSPLTERQRRAVEQAFFQPVNLSLLCHEKRPGVHVSHSRLFFNEYGEFGVPSGEQYTRQGSAEYFQQRETAKAEMYAERINESSADTER